MKKFAVFSLPVLAAYLLLNAAYPQGGSRQARPLEAALERCVRVSTVCYDTYFPPRATGIEYRGTGVIVHQCERGSIVLTNFHVVRELILDNAFSLSHEWRVSVEGAEAQRLRGSIRNDWITLFVPLVTGGRERGARLPDIELAPPPADRRVFSISIIGAAPRATGGALLRFPSTFRPRPARIYVSGIALSPGTSGSGIYDHAGRFIGLLSGKLTFPDGHSIAEVTPASAISKPLRKLLEKERKKDKEWALAHLR